jgi:hypothetical protein
MKELIEVFPIAFFIFDHQSHHHSAVDGRSGFEPDRLAASAKDYLAGVSH